MNYFFLSVSIKKLPVNFLTTNIKSDFKRADTQWDSQVDPLSSMCGVTSPFRIWCQIGPKQIFDSHFSIVQRYPRDVHCTQMDLKKLKVS